MNNEVQFTGCLALSVAVGIFWRIWLIGLVTVAATWVTGPLIPANAILATLVQLVYSFLVIFIAVWWLFGSSRLGSLRIIFMEQAHYQQMQERRTRKETDLDPVTNKTTQEA